ncbi:MAG: hypothetical protein KGS45_02990 [Planctomycetes bacterium]|nr:hypothetical protein [Planctomycetota bacterium]
MMRHLGTILIATLIAALVWIFAEAESVRTREIRIEVEVQADPGSDRVVTVLDGGFKEIVDIVLEGSTTELEGAERLLRQKKIRLAPGVEGISPEPGEQAVDLRTALRAAAGLREAGVTIKSANPSSVRIEVDSMVVREATVRVDVGEGELEASPEVRPAAVKVIMPSRVASALTEVPVVTARLDAAMLKPLVPGRREVLGAVPVKPSGVLSSSAMRLRLDPPAVEVAVRLRNKIDSVTLPTVPVLVRIPPGELSHFDIAVDEADQLVRNVKISGPADLVDKVRREAIKVVATVTLSFSDLEKAAGSTVSKEVTFGDLPPGLTADVPATSVRVGVTRRTK